MNNICSYYGVKADTFRKNYKQKLSNFTKWDQLKYCEQYMLFLKNMGEKLSIDESALSKGELYTFLTNKSGKGKKRTLIASISGTKSEDIIKVFKKIPIALRKNVLEVTLDMANNMGSAVRACFPMAKLVIDRFHVVRLVLEAPQGIRTKFRWLERDIENTEIQKAKDNNSKYQPIVLSNGDSPKQLLARSRYIIAKKEKLWTETQKERAAILFERYPELEKAYKHTIKLRAIYENKYRFEAMIQLKNWIDQTRLLVQSDVIFKEFNTVANTIENHFGDILNFFNNRSTNANAESFNSKIKLFRANQRGVVDLRFFLFRLMNLFA